MKYLLFHNPLMLNKLFPSIQYMFSLWSPGKPATQSSVELKQSLRMALNKSPSVERLTIANDEYRYFKFTGECLERDIGSGWMEVVHIDDLREVHYNKRHVSSTLKTSLLCCLPLRLLAMCTSTVSNHAQAVTPNLAVPLYLRPAVPSPLNHLQRWIPLRHNFPEAAPLLAEL